MNSQQNHQLGQMTHAEYNNYQPSSWNIGAKIGSALFLALTIVGSIAGIFLFIN